MKDVQVNTTFIKGTCFICKKPCDSDSYCHYECAYAIFDEKQKRIHEARAMERQLIKEEKEKLNANKIMKGGAI